MITTDIEGNEVLEIFEKFIIDYGLPKYEKVKDNTVTSVLTPSNFVWTATEEDDVGLNAVSFNTKSGVKMVTKRIHVRFLNKIKEWIAEDPIDVFKQILTKKETVKKFENYVKQLIDDKLAKAKNSGQQALYEQIKSHKERLELEAILHFTKFNQYISEQNVINFTKKSKKGIRLDWIKNFNRDIPEKITALLTDSKTLKIFDNYVIMHYDPENKATKMTKKEIARKRDPILFGVSKNSRNLYFIGDWIDDHCNLTFEELIKDLSKKEVKL